MDKFTVLLNVYEPHEGNYRITNWIGGLGAHYHSGVVFRGVEWTFAQEAGIFSHNEGTYEGGRLYKTISLGNSTVTDHSEFRSIISQLSNTFRGDAYDLVSCNCNHFSEALCKSLLENVTFPSWVNRTSRVVSFWSNRFVSKSSRDKIIQQSQQYQLKQELNQKKQKEQQINSLVDPKRIEWLGWTMNSNHRVLEEEDGLIFIPLSKRAQRLKSIIIESNQSLGKFEVRLFKNLKGSADLNNVNSFESTQVFSNKYETCKQCVIDLKITKWKETDDLTVLMLGQSGMRIDGVQVLGR